MTTETLMTETPATTTEGTVTQEAAPGADNAAPAAEQQPISSQAEDSTSGEGEAKTQPEDEYAFTAPEGREFDPDMLGMYTQTAKELGLSKDAAQKMLDKIAPALADKQTRLAEQAKTEWAELSKSDKEFGGEKLNENLAVAKKALDAFATPELRKLLHESGLGNHPEFIRAFYRAGKAISEDGFVPGGRKEAASADPAKRLFPNQA